MKKIGVQIQGCWSFCLAMLITGLVYAQTPPNIVVIYADDLGYGDVQCYNPDRGKIQTPNIDRLASQGMRFTDGHSSSGVCTPSRYTLLTGRYHWRTRLQRGIVNRWERPLIDADRLTVAGMLAKHGYQTSIVGKWHLGWDWPIGEGQKQFLQGSKKGEQATPEHLAVWRAVFSQPIGGGPTTRGFNTYFGVDVPNWPPFCFIEQDRTVGIPTQFLPAHQFENHIASVQGPAMKDWAFEPILPALGDRSVQYIQSAAKVDAPYFLYLSLTSPHTPLSVNKPWQGSSGLAPGTSAGAYADLVKETDAVVGRMLEAIEQSGEADSTLVLFTSDNGCAGYIGVDQLEAEGHYPSGPLRGYKSDVWEGGHRVPFIVRWPGVVEPGTVSDQLVHHADLLATCAQIVGYKLAADQGEDSVSLLPVLRDPGARVRESAISQSVSGLLGIRKGQWKLIVGKGSGGWTKGQDELPGQLYNLQDDLGETVNLFARHPEKVAELTALLEQQINTGRSTPGPEQPNDVDVTWNRMK